MTKLAHNNRVHTQGEHPAIVLFKKLYAAEVAKGPERGPYLPDMYVNRWSFHAECKKAGIDVPDNPIRMMDWEVEIGLRVVCRKLIAAERRRLNKAMPERERNYRKLEKSLNKGIQ